MNDNKKIEILSKRLFEKYLTKLGVTSDNVNEFKDYAFISIINNIKQKYLFYIK